MPGLFKELQRRNVIRVALGYAVLSWLLLQVGDVLFEALSLDKSAMTMLLAVLILGFIPVIIFSWVYELTPEGVKKESEVDRELSITSHTGQRLNITIVVLLVASIGLFIWDRMSPQTAPATDQPITSTTTENQDQSDQSTQSLPPSIAVLPFADMSAEGDQAYFADGIAEELLNLLASVDGLQVAARTSSFKFRGENLDISEIGQNLKVTTVLEGSVRKSGNQVRITAQLIEVDGGFHLWSQSYDRELDNIFAVQDEISSAIVDALKLELELVTALDPGRAPSGEAYDLYLRGRELARVPSKQGLEQALAYFEQALAIDQDFVPALGGIASAWVWLEDYGGIPSNEAYMRAEPAARRALDLDPTRADALTAMGFLMDRRYEDHIAARDYFERALEANPAFIEAYTLYADVLLDLGEIDKAIAVRVEGIERDPLSAFMKSRLANEYVLIGRREEAEALINEIFAQSPGDTYGMEELANLRLVEGRLAESISAYEFVHENRPGDPYSAANIAIVYGLMGDWEMASEWTAAAAARGQGNRWELEARSGLAIINGDWQAMLDAGQKYASKQGTTWQGQARLIQQEWESARSLFNRALSRMGHVPGTPPNGNMAEAIAGLALAENRLGLPSWKEHADVAYQYAKTMQEKSDYLRGWPSVSLDYLLAQLSAIDGDADKAVQYMTLAESNDFLHHYFIQTDPFFELVRDDPRLIEISQRMWSRVEAERVRLESGQDGG